MRLTLKYDGDPQHARVVCAETDEEVLGVISYTLSGNADDRKHSTLDIELLIESPRPSKFPCEEAPGVVVPD